MRMRIANDVSQVLTKLVQATANTRFRNDGTFTIRYVLYLLITIIHVTEHKRKKCYSILLFYSILFFM